ncbi:dibenzothiophene desulfurization enzyme C [Mycobacteroides abscessus]|uniref:Dibenzothiophene monooxygenase n=4 Tax=Mycobacteriaceae TaxID=1762 RepID=A0A179V550_9MYCO|nr:MULTISPECIES: dibenzothiophene monooxygenase [Mycobacteriaceae]OKH80168.1 dibenzothiophene desulfurization protein C [Mycobacterium sp. SWH-M3]AMU26594.1 dibenzothiophene desulfurization protein C [Mycobacteroides abscessus]AMU36276.1 dibenzothiophene desulfurization protein C [Mycobacteroides abscessus]AMU41322.1 dibenzothiophene desulfurization protein C [Mycobacteroides abscessus]AMU61298.1 dibenzothiophene desulfurization protein C [Mycobacteroides abscessus]
MTLTTNTAKPRPADLADPVAVARDLARTWQDGLIERDRAGGSATTEREDLRASGLLSLAVPQRFGGWGADWPTIFEVIREIAKVDGSLGHLFGYHTVCIAFIELLGSSEQTEHVYRQVAQHNWWAGNASSENNSHVLDWKVRATPHEDGSYRFEGTKHFTSGATDSDLLLVFGVVQDASALQGSIITAVIPTDRAGVTVNDDWDALGMRRTDSGTVEFHDVEVRADEVLGGPNAIINDFFQFQPASLFGPLVQLSFANVYLGIAQGALDAARDYTRTQARPWTPAGVTQAVEDPYVVRAYGEMGIAYQGADAAARDAARLLQTVWDKGRQLTAEDRGELMVCVSGVKALTSQVALDITSRIFEVIGARGTHPRYGFDRFWRNIRTHTLHDPVSYKIAEVGNYILNGRYPVPGFTS